MDITWNEWYTRAKTKQYYIDQENEVIGLIKENCGFINNILDVGCGDGRFSKHFAKWQYLGLDKNYNEFDLLKDEEWNCVDKNFDVCFTSLVLMLFNEKDAKYIFQKMMERGKYILLYEENHTEIEAPYINDKFFHNYKSWNKTRLIKSGYSKFNSKWMWYLYRGMGK